MNTNFSTTLFPNVYMAKYSNGSVKFAIDFHDTLKCLCPSSEAFGHTYTPEQKWMVNFHFKSNIYLLLSYTAVLFDILRPLMATEFDIL